MHTTMLCLVTRFDSYLATAPLSLGQRRMIRFDLFGTSSRHGVQTGPVSDPNDSIESFLRNSIPRIGALCAVFSLWFA